MNKDRSMLRPIARFLASTLLSSLLSGPITSHAQVMSPVTEPASGKDTDKSKENILVLNPFTVTGSKDVGFVATSSLAGGRLASNLSDTPVAYSVLTREFIDALNIGDLRSAIAWTVNASNTPDDGRLILFANELQNEATIRGVQPNQQQIDFFPVFYDYDSYSLERFDFGRGANSILFGAGSFGGTPSASYKQATTDRSFTDLKVTYGSWSYKRAEVDSN